MDDGVDAMSLSVEELDALPNGSVIVRGGVEAFICNDVHYYHAKRLWGTSQSAGAFTSHWVAEGGADLLWSPPA